MKQSNIGKVGFLLAILMLSGKVLSFFKQIIIAWFFGADAVTDAYFLSESFIGIFTTIFSAFISFAVLVEYLKIKNKFGKDKADYTANNIFSFVFCLTIIIFILIIIFAKQIAMILTVGNESIDISILETCIRGGALLIVIVPITFVMCSVLEGNENYWVSKLQSIIISVIAIIPIVFFNSIGVRSIVLGNLAGYIAFAILVFVFLPLPKIRLIKPTFDDSIKNILNKSIYIILSISVVDINHMIDKLIASSTGDGGISALYYGQILSIDIISTILVTSISSLLISKLTTAVVSNDYKGQVRFISQTSNILVFATIFIMLLYLTNGRNLIEFIFHHGSFDSSNVNLTMSVVWGYLFAFPFIPIREILTRIFYVNNNVKFPMYLSIISCIVNLILSVIFVGIMGILGISFATTLSTILHTIMLCIKVHKDYYKLGEIFNFIEFIKVILSSLVTFVVYMFAFRNCNNYVICLFAGTLFITIFYVFISYIFKVKAVVSFIKK